MRSLWSEGVALPRFSALSEDKRTDVLIIGGGMAGLLTAYFLHKAGVDCILVEKGRIADGITADTTAKLTAQHGLCYQKLIKTHGLEAAERYLDANSRALGKYAELCEGIDCDFERRDSYVYSKTNRRALEKEMKALQSIGFSAELCDRLDIPVKTVGAVKFPDQAQFHPLKFLAAIVSELNIYENTCVRETVGTTAVCDGARIRAERMIVATHFPFINKHGSYFLKLYQHRSYVVALQNAADVNGMYVDEDKTGMSFRNHGGLLLLGGGGHRTGKKGGNWQELRRFAERCYPAAEEKYFWAAQDCMSLDGVPYIGRYSKSTPDLYVATGFNKWGMTGAMVSAMILCDLIQDKENGYAAVFDPSRSILKPQLAVNGFETVTNLLTPTAKRCPHLGCALKWNKAERSWDCPCHGSRFSEHGRLIDNPSTGDLDM